ncbi:MAG: translation initiation factor IF-2 [Epsilonproteobacteria bacterium]|nr:translation initiation factor IF-2 [Campylobacterota bacterium]
MKIKIKEVATELGKNSKEIIEICKALGIKNVKAATSSITPQEAAKVAEYIQNPTKEVPKKETPKEETKEEKTSSPTTRKKGIRVVRKAKPKEEKQPQKPKEEKQPPKPKKTTKKKPTPKEKGDELKIDREIAEINTIEEDQVELLDLSFVDIKMDLEDDTQSKQKPKKKSPSKKPKPSVKKTLTKETKKKRVQKPKTKKQETIIIQSETRVYELADKIGKPLQEVIDKFKEYGEELDKNDFINGDYIEMLAEDFGVDVKLYNPIEEFDYVGKYDEIEDDPADLVTRPPIVTVMGHVDHGKTSLLDKIRNTRVAAKEAGGITQHIGAYMVEKDGKKITFLDTPGHAAFASIRKRGANITDIAIIVVAADDGVMPQTREAIKHAQDADVPIIIAINKIDKPDANPDMIMTQMSEFGIIPTDWGGEHEFIKLSAKTGEGIDDLLETINLQAEIMELKANPKRNAKAVVIESSQKKGKGAVATVIVQNGTLRKGDSVVCGTTYGRMRSLMNDLAQQVKEATPSQPVEIVGLNEVPSAGDYLVAVKNDKEAKKYATGWKEYLLQKQRSKTTKATLEDLQKMMLEAKIKKLPVIIKADAHGSVEAIKYSLQELKNDEVRVEVLDSSVGDVTENDIILADAGENKAIILGFNVKETPEAKRKAKQLGIEVHIFSIIYELIDFVKDKLSELLSPQVVQEVVGKAEVRAVFPTKSGTVAGCMVMSGVVYADAYARVIRGEDVVYDGKISSLKRFKDDVKEVTKGNDCGIMLEGFDEFKEYDMLEIYKKIQKKAKFE